MAKDFLGQQIVVGDWCAVTQHNSVIVGKVIREGNSVTIARNRIEELIMLDPKLNNYYYLKNKDLINILDNNNIIFEDFMNNINSSGSSTYSNRPLSFIRDNKFVKIHPTKDMELKYENII